MRQQVFSTFAGTPGHHTINSTHCATAVHPSNKLSAVADFHVSQPLNKSHPFDLETSQFAS